MHPQVIIRLRRAAELVGVALVILATPAAGGGLTLEEAVARALADNPALLAQGHATRAATWNLRQARAQLLPQISLQSNYIRLDENTVRRANAIGRELTMYFPDSSGALQPFTIEIPQTVFRNGYETSISGQMLLLNPALWNAISIAGTARDVADLHLRIKRQDTTYHTLRAFIELLQIEATIRIQEEHLVQARDNRAQAERLLEVGRYAEADVLRWRVEEASQSQQLVQQQSAQRLSALRLENLMGAAPAGRVRPDTLLPASLTQPITRLRTFNDHAWDAFMARPLPEITAGNPQLEVQARAVRMAELEHRQNLTRYLPHITLAGSYGWQQNDTYALDGERAWSLSAVLDLPLFTGLVNETARQVSRYGFLQAQAAEREIQQQIFLAAEMARTAIRSQLEQLRLAEISLENAQRGYAIRQNSFTLGRLSNLEWIDAHLALRSARSDRTLAYYQLLLALVDFHHAQGNVAELVGR